MLTDQYKESVRIFGHDYTLAQLDVTVRVVVLVICTANLILNCIRLSQHK